MDGCRRLRECYSVASAPLDYAVLQQQQQYYCTGSLRVLIRRFFHRALPFATPPALDPPPLLAHG
jgi:hypothetical protein